MQARPVLGIICCNRIVNVEPAQAVMERFVRAAMTYADAAAVLIPSLSDLMAAREVAPLLDGVLLTGSPSNIGAAHYGVPGAAGDAEEIGPFDPGRDEMALGLVSAMIDRGKPVFGICRGFQEINIALGGTLRRDANEEAGMLPHHAPDNDVWASMFDHYHDVQLRDGGILARTYARPAIEVNSVHYQGIDELASELSVEATTQDGLVEAFSANIAGAPILAVQWHPEWGVADNVDSQAYFGLLHRALRGDDLR
ncbi:MAG: gamma-glutamyl-gamma-aminobutyrate hydrolase family protein [Sphingomonadales bacterium]